MQYETSGDSPRFKHEISRINEERKSLPSLPMKLVNKSNSYENTINKDEITEYTKEEMSGFRTVFDTFTKDSKDHITIKDL